MTEGVDQMSLENILGKIVSDGAAEASRLISEANERAEVIQQQGRKDADARRQQILDQANFEADEYELPLLSIAKLEARKSRLLAQQELIQGSFDHALLELRAMSLEDSQKLLMQLLLDAASTGTEQIVVEEQDRKLYDTEFLAKVNQALLTSGRKGALKLSDKNETTGGGFILTSDEMEINATYPALIRDVREQLEPEVVKILFDPSL